MESLLAEVTKVISVFGLSWFLFWPAVPAGLALNLHPLVVIATVVASYSSGVLLVLLGGTRVRAWLLKRFASTTSEPDETSFIRRVWHQYGIIGFGLIAPMTLGAQFGTILGIAFNAPSRKLFIWMVIGAIAWGVILTILASLGIESLETLLGSGV